MESNREISIRLRERLEFYFVALTFTVLAFSIQTAHFGLLLTFNIAELVSWVALLVAGLVGLSRLQTAYAIFNVYGDIQKFRSGQSGEDAELIASAEALVARLNKRQARNVHFQYFAMFIGFALLILSRGAEPVLAVVEDSVVFQCVDSRSKLPVIFEVTGKGYVFVSAHGRDGSVYSFAYRLPGYSRFSTEELHLESSASVSTGFGLNLRSGSFYIADKDGSALYGGMCSK